MVDLVCSVVKLPPNMFAWYQSLETDAARSQAWFEFEPVTGGSTVDGVTTYSTDAEGKIRYRLVLKNNYFGYHFLLHFRSWGFMFSIESGVSFPFFVKTNFPIESLDIT